MHLPNNAWSSFLHQGFLLSHAHLDYHKTHFVTINVVFGIPWMKIPSNVLSMIPLLGSGKNYYAYEMNLGNLGETFTCKSDTITVHAPHPPSPQPNFVPQRPSLRRRKVNSVNPGSSKFSSTTFLPEVNNHFTFNIYMAQACIKVWSKFIQIWTTYH